MSPPLKLTFSHHSHKGDPLCTVVQTEWARCATTAVEEQTLKESETEEASQSVNCLPPAQHQTDETSLGWINRRLCMFVQMFSGPPCWIKGKKFNTEGLGVCGSQHQHSGGGGTDHTGEA